MGDRYALKACPGAGRGLASLHEVSEERQLLRPRRPPVARTALRFPSRYGLWIGRGTAFSTPTAKRGCTLLAVWYVEQEEPWSILTDLPPEDAGPGWYALRFWIELGFKAIKSLGWKWDKTRRTDPARISRHWLALSVATLLALAYGTKVEDAHDRRLAPGNLRTPPKACPVLDTGTPAPRRRKGLSWGFTHVLETVQNWGLPRDEFCTVLFGAWCCRISFPVFLVLLNRVPQVGVPGVWCLGLVGMPSWERSGLSLGRVVADLPGSDYNRRPLGIASDSRRTDGCAPPGLGESRNLDGNPDSPQAVVFLTPIIDVLVGY